MNRTKIEWCDYTWNYITGCKRGCSYCYAKKIRERFTPEVPFNELMWFDKRLGEPLRVKKPSKIFVGSMSDIEYWRKVDILRVIDIIRQCPQHTFMFLTKNGEVYKDYVFPKNSWLGVTITGNENYKIINNNNNKIFLSIEPLLSKPKGLWLNSLIDWIIIGGLTPKPTHKKEWIDNILKEADRLKVPVFIKHNTHYSEIRQEFPKGLE